MLNDNLQIFRDLGGGSLHRRGYRSGAAIHKAALVRQDGCSLHACSSVVPQPRLQACRVAAA